jgi:TolB-like protein/Flp pilus assembly protein TadD
MITVIRVCRKCGAKIFSDAPEGLCTRCVLGTALRTLPEETVVATRRDDPVIQNRRADSLVGETIGHYKISEPIGTGGMGEVYLATDIVAGRKAALKLLPMRFTGDAERLKRFEQEAHAVVGLNHPNILTVYEIGEDHSIHYIASELIEGETLRQYLMRGRMQLSEAVDIAIQVASALAAAHQAGIVHRDIKPENIMLRRDGYVKVLDFGIAKLAEQEVPLTTPRDEALLLVETSLGSVLGTARYMSPEQACGAPVDKGTDIWSLGVVLYEMVTGHAPFTGQTPGEVMSAILEKEPPPLTRYVAHARSELQQIINKTLRKDRKERYRSAHDLLEALKDLRRKLEFESVFMSGFFDEVKRRKVYRVAAAYIIVAAGIIQLASAAFPAWDLPNWALRLVIVLLLIGFPLVLILGWVFDLTSQGIRVTPGTHRRRYGTTLVTTGIIISAAAGFFLLPRVSAHKLDKSIAVLPFENRSEEKQNAYFADGVQDEILTDLAKVADLKVISRTSVLQYKSGVARNLRGIGQQLGVANVVEGSVQRFGNRVRVNAQLIDARTDAHLWSQTYDRDLSDIFAIQSEIARAIADQLKAKISAGEKAAIAEKPTRDLVAYDFYVRATALIDTADPPSQERDADLLREAVELLNQAVARDPAFLLAYCKLARAHDALYFHGFDKTGNQPALAKAAIDSAFRLKPDSDEAHLALALHLYYGYLEYDQARDEVAIAARTLPNDARVFQLAARIDRRQGRWHDAVRNFERAVELDPQNPENLAPLRETYRMMRAYKQARETADRRLALKSNAIQFPTLRRFQIDLEERADTRPLHAALEKILRDNPAAAGRIVTDRFVLALYERDFAAADRVLASLTEHEFGEIKAGIYFNRAIAEGVIAHAKGDVAAAHDAFAAARSEVEQAAREEPDLGNIVVALGFVYAGCGLKEEALREARRSIEVWPVTKDALGGAGVLYFSAVICAWTGERDLAIEQLETLAKIPNGASYGDLRLDPNWDSLRGDPRFERIVASLAPK